jgi:hypothetical protein
MVRRLTWALMLSMLPLSASGCGFQLEKLFPDRVADGVARLSIQNLGQLVSLISADTNCGFASQQVLDNEVADVEIGQVGTLTSTVTSCVLDFGDELVLDSVNCNGTETRVKGAVIVDAIRTVHGRITGDPGTPVIPDSSEAAYFEIRAEFAGYEVRRGEGEQGLTMHEGVARYTVRPHLARAESTGACSVPGANLTFEEITMRDLIVDVDSGDSVFPAEIPEANFSAQLGRWGNKENWFGGTVTAWDTTVEVPIEGEPPGIDPGYDGDEFFESYACTEDMQLPVDYTCPDFTPQFAQGVAQLTIATYANVMQLLEADTTCGFSSPQVLNNPELLGELGEAGGQARYVIDEPCALDIPQDTIVSVNCLDDISFAEGRAWVTGTKVISGIRTGGLENPVVPTNSSPALFTLDAELENFKSFDSAGVNKLLVRSGRISGSARPQTAIDTVTGACSIVTPVVGFENIRLENADAQLFSNERHFDVEVASTNLMAQNGELNGVENMLAGEISIDGQELPIPVEGDPILNPSYDPERFDEAFACTDNMVLPTSASDCSFAKVLGEGAARLIVAGVGAIASQANANTECGFDAYTTLLFPYLVEGEPGEMGLMSWNIDNCLVGSDGLVEDPDCAGGRTITGGWADVTATRYVSGERTQMIGVIDAIEPRDRESVEIVLTDVALDDFSVELWSAGASMPRGTLTLHSGTLSGTVMPIMGEMASEPGRFEVATPVAILSDITLNDAQATLVSEGMTFNITFDDVLLNAVNGTWNGQSNTISGSLSVNGETVVLDPQPLDDGFDQAAFDQSYACTEDLLEIIPAD